MKVVAGDGLPGGAWTIVEDMLKDKEVMDAVDIIGLEVERDDLHFLRSCFIFNFVILH